MVSLVATHIDRHLDTAMNAVFRSEYAAVPSTIERISKTALLKDTVKL